MHWHLVETKKVIETLHSSPDGLSSEQATAKRAEFGSNELIEKKRASKLYLFAKQFKDIMILILLAAAVVSGIIGDLTDTIVILVIVLLNAILGFTQEFKAEKALYALKKASITMAKVFRDGKQQTMRASELVPGDVVLLEAGDNVPADLRLLEAYQLKIEESSLTGESEPINKTADTLKQEVDSLGDQVNMAFKGSFVGNGRGKAIVVATGMQTEIGQIASMLDEAITVTPLQQNMATFAKKLSIIVLFLCILFFVAGKIRGEEIVQLVLTSISLAVAAIPEALPAVITISLALAAKRMIRINSLVRKLAAVEALGSVSFICTDKTGTLTKNEMHVGQVYIDGNLMQATELKDIDSNKKLHLLLQAFASNNDSETDGKTKNSGDRTEIALLELAIQHGFKKDSLDRVEEIPFDADRKLMTTFHRHENKFISFTKGAPEILLERCVDIDKEMLVNQVETLASEGERVMGFAYRTWDQIPKDAANEDNENNLNFLGLAGILDPPREEVPDAIRECHEAGIAIVMITGDHLLTAQSIAKKIGIITRQEDIAITGQELAALDDETLESRIQRIRLYARVSPAQKLRIVTTLQKKGHFVAMTGDGVNDAPALKAANIGIAMGITGTDVTREAADMVLLDDNFSTIVKAVKEGRRIYDNILKFIKYLMTTNSGEIWTLLLGPLIGLPVALLPIHILWINLVSDGLPAISLSFEKAEKSIMKRAPRPPGETVFAQGRGMHMIWVGMLMAAIVLLAQAWAIETDRPWQTIVFNILCLSQMGHVLAIRSDRTSFLKKDFFSNRLLIASVALVFLLQFAITYIPFLQVVFKTEPLTWQDFLVVGLASSLVYFAVEAEKFFLRGKRKQTK